MSLSTARFETLKAKADRTGPGRSRPTTRPSPWEPGGALQSDPPLSYPGLHLLSSSASTGSSGHPAPGRGHSPATALGVDPRKDLKGSEGQDELQATTFYPGKASGLGRPSALLLGQTACLGPPCGSGEGWRAGTGEAQWPGRADQGPMWENFGLGRGDRTPGARTLRPHPSPIPGSSRPTPGVLPASRASCIRARAAGVGKWGRRCGGGGCSSVLGQRSARPARSGRAGRRQRGWGRAPRPPGPSAPPPQALPLSADP